MRKPTLFEELRRSDKDLNRTITRLMVQLPDVISARLTVIQDA
jgi:hypothetical protein